MQQNFEGFVGYLVQFDDNEATDDKFMSSFKTKAPVNIERCGNFSL